MGDKGAIHVDWAVSMALFLLFIIGILVFLKPGVLSLYDDEYLTGLVADEVMNRSFVRLEEVPITFVPTQAIVSLPFSDPFPLCGDANANKYVVVVGNAPLPAQSDPKRYQVVTSGACVSEVRVQGLASEKQTIRLVHFAAGSWENGAITCPPTGCESIDGQLRSVGVKETKKGVGQSALKSVLGSLDSTEEYAAFKTQIHFPARKSFRVCKDVVTDETCTSSAIPPSDADITARTVSEVVLSDTAQIEGKVDVIVQVW